MYKYENMVSIVEAEEYRMIVEGSHVCPSFLGTFLIQRHIEVSFSEEGTSKIKTCSVILQQQVNYYRDSKSYTDIGIK